MAVEFNFTEFLINVIIIVALYGLITFCINFSISHRLYVLGAIEYLIFLLILNAFHAFNSNNNNNNNRRRSWLTLVIIRLIF